nr:MAG TPA_asm: hypothetical protein [Bacteriophage sp.]
MIIFLIRNTKLDSQVERELLIILDLKSSYQIS